MEKYKTGTGQILNVHTADECVGRNCCIHRPSDHKLKYAPTHWRDDINLMERICMHGVSHPDPDDLAYKKNLGLDIKRWSVHGCCGCCGQEEDTYQYSDKETS